MLSDKFKSGELIIFFDGDQIIQEMTYSEFEAVLDNYASIAEFSGCSVDGAYVSVDTRLNVKGIVLFSVDFNAEGFASTSWNVPLCQLLNRASRNPASMSKAGYPIVCKRTCDDARYQNFLWNPRKTANGDTFTMIHEAVRRNSVDLPCEAQASDLPSEAPLLNNGTPQMQQGMYVNVSGMSDGISDRSDGLTESQLAVLENENRRKIAALTQHQSAQLKALEAQYNHALAQLNQGFETQLGSLHQRIANLEQERAQLQVEHKALTARHSEATHKVTQLEITTVDKLAALQRKAQQQLDAQQEEFETRLIEEKQAVREVCEERRIEQVSALENELETNISHWEYLEETVKTLRQELCDLRRDKLRLCNQGGDKFLERLTESGISFIAFHPGAGHISVPLDDMTEYVENPQAYAAQHCLVEEQDYKTWLAHYNEPRCTASTAAGVCGCSITRCDNPKVFVPGKHDRCDQHQQVDGDDGAQSPTGGVAADVPAKVVNIRH